MEAALLEAFRRGDADALERVYFEHVADVERVVRAGLARLGRLSAANLADVVQEVFLKAFSAPARTSYDGVRAYAPFLATIARHALRDWARRGGRELVDSATLEARLDAQVHATADELFPAELVEITAGYVQALPANLRAVHERRFIAAEPQRRAAQALGISRQTLRTLERKLIDGLRRELRRFGGGDTPEARRRNPNRVEESE